MSPIAICILISVAIGVAVAALEAWIVGPDHRRWPSLVLLAFVAAAGWPLFVLGGFL